MDNSRRSLVISLGALVILIALSACPWESWTGGRLKDFHLFSDLMPEKINAEAAQRDAADNIDPELLAFVAAEESDSVASRTVDTEIVADSLPAPVFTHVTEAPRKGDVVMFEDYSRDQNGFARIKSKLAQASSRPVRIAMVGDSYIEGDILAQDIRAGLQSVYGGRGVGYVSAHSNFPGFRGSVVQSGDNWTEHEIRKMGDEPLRTILGLYHTARNGASARYKGSKKPDFVDYWTNSTLIYHAPESGDITFCLNGDSSIVYNIQPAIELQAISIPATTRDISYKTNIPGLDVLGIWLEDHTGIILDDISLRGNSGISHRNLNAVTTAQMRKWIDYDIIILEFGMNALSASQRDYTAYARGMDDVIANLRTSYPNAEIVVMGIGDRGTKVGTGLGSMSTVPAMINAQRAMAQRTGSIFYDTRAAMGGDGAAVEWNKRHLLNSDYVHLNHKGGRELAKIFLESLNVTLDN